MFATKEDAIGAEEPLRPDAALHPGCHSAIGNYGVCADCLCYRAGSCQHSDSRNYSSETKSIVAQLTVGVESVTSSFIAKSYQSSVDCLQ